MAAFLDDETSNFSNILTTPASKFGHLLYPTILISILLSAYRFILKDYHAFLALGPGGTPSTFAGYLRVTYLRLFTISDPFQPPSLAQPTCPQGSYLYRLPQRSGPRPITAGIAPHRQLDQKCGPDLHHALRRGLHTLAAGCPSLLREGNSCFEKNGLALFLSACVQANAPESISDTVPTHLNPTCQDTGEICHLHASVSFNSSNAVDLRSSRDRDIFGPPDLRITCRITCTSSAYHASIPTDIFLFLTGLLHAPHTPPP